MMKTLSFSQVILLHKKLIAKTGGMSGTKDLGLIKSALERHKATFDGVDLYPTILEKISATTVSLVSNHGFVDGNKRVGVTVMLMLLKMNDISLTFTQLELIELGLGLAEGIIKEDQLMNWIKEHLIE